MDRLCFCQLLEKSRTENSKRALNCRLGEGACGDTSLRQNWSCFRNEMYNRKPIEVTLENFTPMPSVGRLEFDYSMTWRPDGDHEDITPLDDIRFVKILHNLCLIG
jgi:hypothetical protein